MLVNQAKHLTFHLKFYKNTNITQINALNFAGFFSRKKFCEQNSI